MNEIHVDASAFRRMVENYKAFTGADVDQIVRLEMGSLARSFIRLTYPKTNKQGKDAVERDILKVYTSPADLFKNGAKMPSLDAAIKSSNWDTATAIITKLNRFKNLEVVDSVDPDFHQRFKNKSGRVSTRSGPFKIVRNPDVLRAYIKDVQAHVGKAKASWLSAANKWGAAAAAFITRHGAGEGSATDAIKDGTGYLEAISKSKAMGDIEGRASIVSRALAATEKHLTIKLESMLEKRARDASR